MPALHRLRPALRQQLLLLLASVLGVLWLAAAWANHTSEGDELEQIRQQTQTLALAFSEHTESTVQRVDYTLLRLREAWVAEPANFANAVARHQNLLGDTTLQVAIIGADGYLAYSNLGKASGHPFLGDREHFSVHSGTKADVLFVSEALKGRVSGKWSIQLTRPIFSAGRFAGVIVLSVDPDYFVRFYQKLDIGMNTLVAITSDKGTIMARSLEQDRYIGQQVTATPYTAPGAALRGSFRRPSTIDSVERMFGYSRLPAYGVTVLVAADLQQQLSPVRRQQRLVLMVTGAVTLVLVLMGGLMWRGITRREVAEQSLRDSQAFATATIDAVSAQICVLDKAGAILAVNKAWREFGDRHRTRSEQFQGDIGRNYLEVCDAANGRSAQQAALLAQGIRGVTRGELNTYATEYPAHFNGEAFWFMVRVTRFDGASGNVVVAHENMTERKQAQTRLQLAASVFTHAREGIMITDADGTIVEVNGTFTHLTGYSREDAVGQNPRMLNSGRQTPEHYARMWKDLTDTGYWTGEVWNRRKSGEVFAEMQTISAVRDADGHTQNYVALFTDITPMKEQQARLEHIAHFDALTGLPNRVLLADRLQLAIAQCQRRKRALALVFLDLDGFKAVNDIHGHNIGDELLITLAQHMKAALRDGDTLARIGGDEFVAVLVDLEQAQDCEPVLQRLLRAAATPVTVGDAVLRVSASMGVTLYPQDGSDADLLMRHADQAMYQAKGAGKSRYHLFDVVQDAAVKTQRESLDHIRQAMDRHEFVLHYQPKVNMKTGSVIGAEALIRWQHPERGLLAPGTFLPIIEDHSLSVELGEWVIDTALTQMAAWQAAGLAIGVSVNIGARQLQQSDFAKRLSDLLATHPTVAPHHLELEVLETSALEDMAQVSEVIHACHAIGVHFALDDFGTGYSSLTYLKRLPAATLKIDQSFVRGMLDDPDDLAIVEGVIGLTTAFRRQVIAEGVETVAHGELLLSLGCDLAQGYGIAHPMPAHTLQQWANTWRPDGSWNHWRGHIPNRDTQILVFAEVEHRHWQRALEMFLSGEQGNPPPMEPDNCHFGRWQEAEGRARFGTHAEFAALTGVHDQVHALGRDLLQLHASGREAEVRLHLESMHTLHAELIRRLRQLVQGAPAPATPTTL